jgi:hypothetical protein
VSFEMTSIPAKVIAIEKRGDQHQVIVQIGTKYRGSFNTLAFGKIKPYSGSLKDGRLDLVYYRDPGLAWEINFQFGLSSDVFLGPFRVVSRIQMSNTEFKTAISYGSSVYRIRPSSNLNGRRW